MRGFLVIFSVVCGCLLCEERPEYCNDRVSIVINKPSRWESGEYTIDITADGDSYRCAVWLPRAKFPLGGCDGDVYWSGSRTEIDYLSLAGTPEAITVRVALEGTVLADAAFRPSYHEEGPDSPYCGESCEQATVDVDVE